MAFYYVSPSGSDGANGAIATPVLTVNHGISLMSAGDTLFLRGGTYAERIISGIPSGSSWAAPTRIRGYRNELAILQPPISFYGNGTTPHPGIELVDAYAYIEFANFILDGSKFTTALNVDGVKIAYDGPGAASNNIRLLNLIIRNFTGNGVLITEDSANSVFVRSNEILNCKIYNNGQGYGHGIYAESNLNVIDNCDIYGNGEYGVHIYNEVDDVPNTNPDDASANQVSNNRCYNNGYGFHSSGAAAHGWGIGIFVGDANVAYNNTCYGNRGGGIRTYIGSTGTLIYNNTVYNNQLIATAGGIEIGSTSTGAIVKNNIAYGNQGGDYYNTGASTTASTNLFGTDPKFVSVAKNDYRLKNTSPARLAGAILTAVPTYQSGLDRASTAYDVGACEPVGLSVT